MVEAADIKCPTCFIILPLKRTFPEDSTEGADNTPSDTEVLLDAAGAPEKVKEKVTSWVSAFCTVSSKVNEIAGKVKKAAKGVQRVVEAGTDILAGDSTALTELISEKFSAYVEGKSESLWLYLVDEATGEVVKPPDGSNYPIEITTPGKTLPVLLPLAKIGLKAMCITNNVAKLGRAFGYPLPLLGENVVNLAKSAIGDLSKESSVAEFDVLQNHLTKVTEKEKKEEGNANTEKQDPETIRGVALREFQRWLEDNDEHHKFCDLQRVLTSEGKSCWTTEENAKKMEKGEDVLNKPKIDQEDSKRIDEKVLTIQKENEEIKKKNEDITKAYEEMKEAKEKLERERDQLGKGETPAEGASTRPLPSHHESSKADKGTCRSKNDTPALDEECTYVHECIYLHVYECMYTCECTSS
jgi:FtsZ-binding cell division protein ZapB